MDNEKIAEELVSIAKLLLAKDRFTKQEWSTYKRKHPKADPRNFIIEEKMETRDRGKGEDERTQAEAISTCLICMNLLDMKRIKNLMFLKVE